MVKGRVSIILPARNERFLGATVQDVLAKARGDVEVIAVLDGYYPSPQLPDDPRLRFLHFGAPHGMRPAINAGVRMATGQYLLKADAHCMFDEGFDIKLVADYHDDHWVLIPRRYALEPESWTIDETNKKYPIDYHYLSSPFEVAEHIPLPGLHGSAWTARREARKDILLDDEMSSQGSCWVMSRAHWDWLGELSIAQYGNFICEMQEIGLKTWLGGGAMKVTKNTWYAHLYKGRRYRRGYSLGPTGHHNGTAFCAWYWMTDQWAERIHDIRWLIDKFWPVPTWSSDPEADFARARRELANPYQVAA